jgi:hypothetical protein
MGNDYQRSRGKEGTNSCQGCAKITPREWWEVQESGKAKRGEAESVIDVR